MLPICQTNRHHSYRPAVTLDALVSPHQLRHGLADRLWKTATPEAMVQILGHSRVAMTLKYGKPTEDDLRTALKDASRIR